uniref:KIB1-4 beta-propeller domain-containing protein n=1 Tax=Leersia perrieri TaxID=77586 RepID=A0A0D9W263_9ORYZ
MTSLSDLPPELLADIHGRLSFVDRLAFAAAVAAPSRAAFKPEPPWLVLPGDTPTRSTLFSVADRRSATVRASDPATRDYVIIGSSHGLIVTADDRGRMRLANPVTGDQVDLPAISTIPFVTDRGDHFDMVMEPFLQIRYSGVEDEPGTCRQFHADPHGTHTLTADRMRLSLYNKVVLSASPRDDDDFAAMLLVAGYYGAPAFATAKGGQWRFAPSRDGVEDAIHRRGKFVSVTYTGVVQEWERDGETFTSKVVTTAIGDRDDDQRRPHDAPQVSGGGTGWAADDRCQEDQQVLLAPMGVQLQGEARWEDDIGDLAILVGINSSMCVSTAKHPDLKAGCIYYTDDEMGMASVREDARRWWDTGKVSWFNAHDDDDSKRNVGVYSLKDGKLESLPELGKHLSWPPPAWFTPCFP